MIPQCSGAWEQTSEGLLRCTGQLTTAAPWWEISTSDAQQLIAKGVLLLATVWVLVQIRNAIE